MKRISLYVVIYVNSTFVDVLIKNKHYFSFSIFLTSIFSYRHVMFAPSMYDSYSDNSFPGIVDTMNEIEHHHAVEKWAVLKQQVSIATFTIQSAANTLKDIGL